MLLIAVYRTTYIYFNYNHSQRNEHILQFWRIFNFLTTCEPVSIASFLLYDAQRIFRECHKLNAVALPFLDRVELGYLDKRVHSNFPQADCNFPDRCFRKRSFFPSYPFHGTMSDKMTPIMMKILSSGKNVEELNQPEKSFSSYEFDYYYYYYYYPIMLNTVVLGLVSLYFSKMVKVMR